jgi:hypothetical protein
MHKHMYEPLENLFHFEKIVNWNWEFFSHRRTCVDEIEYMEIAFAAFQSLVCGYSIYTTRVDFIFRSCGFLLPTLWIFACVTFFACVEWIILGLINSCGNCLQHLDKINYLIIKIFSETIVVNYYKYLRAINQLQELGFN